MVEVIWYGHACFELRGTTTTIVLDPFGGLGIPEPKAEADIVLCSHSHRDHNNIAPVLKEGGTAVEGFVGPWTYFQGGTCNVCRSGKQVKVQGIDTFHDAVGGSQRGKNSVYVIDHFGVKLCHLGDLGHDLTAEQIERIGDLDVLFTPAGGGPQTIGFDIASSIVERLKPKIVVPMHYNFELPGNPELLSRFGRVDDFLKGKKNVKKIDGRSFIANRQSLPKEQTIIVPSFEQHS